MIGLVWIELSPLGLETDCLGNKIKEKAEESVDQGTKLEEKDSEVGREKEDWRFLWDQLLEDGGWCVGCVIPFMGV